MGILLLATFAKNGLVVLEMRTTDPTTNSFTRDTVVSARYNDNVKQKTTLIDCNRCCSRLCLVREK